MKVGVCETTELKKRSEMLSIPFADLLWGYAVEDLMLRVSTSAYREFLWLMSLPLLGEEAYRQRAKKRIRFFYKGSEEELTPDKLQPGQRLSIAMGEHIKTTLFAKENAQKYFERYNKLKRTFEALSTLTVETENELAHLESIMTSIDIAASDVDLDEIRRELGESGYIKSHGPKGRKDNRRKCVPYHYLSSDGFDIYVGKNNYQNDELTFKFATGNDWWFHAKKMPGSHVVVKTKDGTLPDRTFEEAGNLAAFYSKGRTAPKVEIDYLQKKNVKKPAGAKPGFVVYYTNYSLMAVPDIHTLTLIDD